MTDYENLSKNIQKNDFEKPAALPKDVVDSAMQTDGIGRIDGSYQTERSERKDFQVQVHLQKQVEPISTQTDSATLCDFQVQANIAGVTNSIATQTIKEEIRMPNIPSSVAQTPAKKRKLSPVSTLSAVSPNVSIDVSLSREHRPNGSGDQPSNNQAVIEPIVDDSSATKTISNGTGDQPDSESAVIDDGILKSEVYQIYCRNEDPKEAWKQIKKLKSCVVVRKAKTTFLAEKDFKNACETALDRL